MFSPLNCRNELPVDDIDCQEGGVGIGFWTGSGGTHDKISFQGSGVVIIRYSSWKLGRGSGKLCI